ALFSIAITSASFATTFTVPSGKTPTIQSALVAANQNGDDIIVSPGIYFEQIDFLGKSVWLHSQLGNSITIIDGQGIAGNLVSFITAEDENAIIEGFTLRNVPNGSAVGCQDSSSTIIDCKIVGNSTDSGDKSGAGVWASNSNITIEGCEIKNNFANAYGGGLYFVGGSLTMSDTLVQSNEADRGGGLYCDSGVVVGLSNCMFSLNTAYISISAHGGAIRINGGSLSAVGCSFDSNLAESSCDCYDNPEVWGGAIFAQNTYVMLTNCTSTDNLATNYDNEHHGQPKVYGGSIALIDGTSGTITNCLFSFDSVTKTGSDDTQPHGGAVVIRSSNVTFNNTDFLGCHADRFGGAVYVMTNGNPTFTDCSFVSCTAEDGGAIFSDGIGAPFILSGHFSGNSATDKGGAIYSRNSS
ncbi:MAG: hypothetical protein QF704_13720, partial [Anaerolineales bacterium]|nr:hypothetical protein [Anaerolineales bacterium]